MFKHLLAVVFVLLLLGSPSFPQDLQADAPQPDATLQFPGDALAYRVAIDGNIVAITKSLPSGALK